MIVLKSVGKGLHSTNGQARIKPAVEELMAKYVQLTIIVLSQLTSYAAPADHL